MVEERVPEAFAAIGLQQHGFSEVENLRRVIAAQCENLDGVADWGERVAQLMSQYRQELVLAPIGLPQRLGLTAERLIH